MSKSTNKAVSGGTEPITVRGMVLVKHEPGKLQKRAAAASGLMFKLSTLVYWNVMILAAFSGMSLPSSVAFGAWSAIAAAVLILVTALAFGDETQYKG